MKRVTKLILAFFFSCVFVQLLKAQTNKKLLTVIADTVTTPGYKNTKIIVSQGKQLIKSSLNQPFSIDEGVELNIEFANSLMFISGIKNLKIHKDTIISLQFNLMTDVIVKGKKKIVSETLTGFNYYPQNDSLFRTKSILLALQRLPFITVPDDYSLPKYKGGDQKILFLINGKPRYGLEGGWIDVLRAVKAKDIFRVELIEDIPVKYRNQGYYIVIDIQTIDANIYGESFNLAFTFDGRKNLNTELRATLLRRKSDFSLQCSAAGDNLTGIQNAIIYKDDQLINQQSNLSTHNEKSRRFAINYGYRIDSFNDVSLNVVYNKFDYKNAYINTLSYPTPQNNISNASDRDYLNMNASWVGRRKNGITKSLAFAGNVYQDAVYNRLAFLFPRTYDSSNIMSKLNHFHWILEYNFQNNKDPNFSKEAGIQVYDKWVSQDFNQYDIEPTSNNTGKLLYSSQDTLRNTQFSVRPYFRLGKNFSSTKRLAVSSTSELFIVKNKIIPARAFWLPQIRVNFKKILSNVFSLRNILEFGFEKPSEDFLALVQLVTEPVQRRTGNGNLIPAKYINESIEFIRRKKSVFSCVLSYRFSFDDINYFRYYDTATAGKLINLANNGGVSHTVGPYLFYQMPATKKLSFWISITSLYSYSSNKKFHTSNSGFFFGWSHALKYEISPKIGIISFSSFLNSNGNGSQGYHQGSMKYMVSYGTAIFKNHISVSFLAQNFLMKQRGVRTYSFNGEYQSSTNVISPYRLLSLRLAYNFSNIKIAKFAATKSTEIWGEKAAGN